MGGLSRMIGVREMHVRHPDGHVLRIGTGIEEAE